MPFCGLSLFLVNCKKRFKTCETYILEQRAFVALSVNEGIARTDPEQGEDVAADVGSRAAEIQAVSTLSPFSLKRERLSLNDIGERAWDRF